MALDLESVVAKFDEDDLLVAFRGAPLASLAPPHPNPWHPWDPTTDGNSGRERRILARLCEVAEAEGDDMPETTHPTAVAPAVNALPLPFFRVAEASQWLDNWKRERISNTQSVLSDDGGWDLLVFPGA